MRISRAEMERNAPLNRELREFLAKVVACGAPYQQWCSEIRQEFPALVRHAYFNDVCSVTRGKMSIDSRTISRLGGRVLPITE